MLTEKNFVTCIVFHFCKIKAQNMEKNVVDSSKRRTDSEERRSGRSVVSGCYMQVIQ